MKYDVEFISVMSKWNMIYSLCNCAILKQQERNEKYHFKFKVNAKIIIINIHPMILLATGAT